MTNKKYKVVHKGKSIYYAFQYDARLLCDNLTHAKLYQQVIKDNKSSWIQI